MDRRQWLALCALSLCLAGSPGARGAQLIESAFGQTLGQRFDPAKATDIETGRDSVAFIYPQPRTLPILSRFQVLVTPFDYTVYGILADDTLPDQETCVSWQKKLLAITFEKYVAGSPDTKAVESGDHLVIQIDQPRPHRRIGIACDAAGQLSMLYDDVALKEQAAAEHRLWNQWTDDLRAGHGDAALPHLQELADKGNVQTQLYLAIAYRNAWGVPRDDTQAEALYLKAARAGLLDAQYNLGTFYLANDRLDQALPWLQKAADRGRVSAQFNLAQLRQKPGPLFDLKESFRWALAAAQGNHLEAQYNTCNMYSAGDGVERSEVDAWMWCDVAAARGDRKARENRDYIEKRMQPVETVRARMLSRQWQAAHSNP